MHQPNEDKTSPIAAEDFYSGRSIEVAVIRTEVDFGALLEPALEAEAAQTHSGEGDDSDAAPVRQDLSSSGTSNEALSIGFTPQAPGNVQPSPLDNRTSSVAGTPTTAPASSYKSNQNRKGKVGRASRAKKHSERRRARRAEDKNKRSPFTFKLKVRMAQRHGVPKILHANLYARDFPVNQNAYAAKRQDRVGNTPSTLQGLKDIGFKIVPWDGKEVASLLDLIELGIGHLAGQPQDPEWPSVADDAAKVFEQARLDSGLQPGQGKEGKRGHFVALSAGVTHSPRSNIQGPRYRENGEKEKEIIDRLVTTPSIRRIATFQSQSLAYYAPKVYEHYSQNLKPIYEDYGLDLLFRDSIFPSSTFNLGPGTACCVHVDCQNCPYGFCAITALGNYDPKKGGHLVLWDLRIAIEFPPGSTILIPSACLRHGNTAIQPGESRYSFTQFCPGALIQWRRCGYRNVGALTPAEILDIDGPKGARREKCLNLLSKYHELAEDQQFVFGSKAE